MKDGTAAAVRVRRTFLALGSEASSASALAALASCSSLAARTSLFFHPLSICRMNPWGGRPLKRTVAFSFTYGKATQSKTKVRPPQA